MSAWKGTALHRLFADAVGEVLQRRNLSHAAFAKHTGLEPGTVSAYLRGDRTPPPAVLEQILAACGRELAVVPAGVVVPPGAADLLRLIAAELEQSAVAA